MSVELNPAGPPIPKTFKEYLRSFGPGILMVLTWLGAGDIVDSSVAGAQYGYALMWGLALALISRWWLVTNLTKYHLCNSAGDTSIIMGFQRVWTGLPWMIGATIICLSFVFGGAYINGISHVFGLLFGGSELMWGVIQVVILATLIYLKSYDKLEKFMKYILLLMVLAFVVLVFMVGVKPLEIIKGVVLFELPETVGAFGAILVVIALIGGVGGSMANLLYCYFITDKGWRGPGYRKLANFDLLFAIIVIIILNLIIWISAAEVLKPAGIKVEGIDSLVKTLGTIFGRGGEILMLAGLWGAIASSLVGFAYGYATMFVDVLHIKFPARREKYGELKKDPIFLWYAIGWGMIVPFFFMLPGMPNFVFLTVIGSALHTLTLPFLALGLVWMVNNPKNLPKEYCNKWWENVMLGGLVALALWAFFNGIKGIFGMIVG